MTQDLVTTVDVATPLAAPLQLPDAQLICAKLDDGLAAEAVGNAIYSTSIKHLFQLAWAVAAHRRNRQVTIHHVAYVLVFEHPEVGNKLVEHLESDIDSFAVGCILQALPLGVSAGNPEVLPPAVGTVRWVGEAAALAHSRGRQSELQPADLVQSVLDQRLTDAEYSALKRAARTGNARRDVVLGSRSAQPIAFAPKSSREIILHWESVEQGAAAAGPPDDVAKVAERLEEFKQRYVAYADDQSKALARIEALLKKPSGTRVTAAILAVLTLGAAAGLALTLFQPGSTLAQVVSALVK